MPRRPCLDATSLEVYRTQGVVRLGTVLEPSEVAQIHQAVDALQAECGSNDSGVIVHDTWRRHPACAEIVRSTWLGEVACRLLGRPGVVLFQDNLVWKLPGSARIEWHQDYSYQPLSAPLGVTLWLSLDHVVPQSGCLHYVPGTHLLGERAPADFILGSNQPRREDLLPLDIAAHADAIQPFPTTPGELIAHHPLVWHMSPKNQSTRNRRAISVNWIDPSVRWRPSQAPHPYNFEFAPMDGDPFDPARFPVFERAAEPPGPA